MVTAYSPSQFEPSSGRVILKLHVNGQIDEGGGDGKEFFGFFYLLPVPAGRTRSLLLSPSFVMLHKPGVEARICVAMSRWVKISPRGQLWLAHDPVAWGCRGLSTTKICV